MEKELLNSLESQGYRTGMTSVQHLSELQEILDATHRQGLLDEGLYQDYLTGFSFCLPEELPQACSLIAVAVPQRQTRFIFNWEGKQVAAFTPPTYLHAGRIDEQMEETLKGLLEPEGYHVVMADLPKKSLVTRIGLAKYGRNNITYIPGMGSFYRLVVFYSDLPCEEDPWSSPEMLKRCEICRACAKFCPTGAITAERFLLHAERCIVFHNEKSGDVPFPAWIDPAWHNALMGCMHCQRVCPENKELLTHIEEGTEFTQEETALFVKGTQLEQLPDETAKKLEVFDMAYLLDAFPRNLMVLLNQ